MNVLIDGYQDFKWLEGNFDAVNDAVIKWVDRKVKEYNLAELTTLEVGSRYINGTAKWSFKGPFIGIDFIDGPLVDIVMDAHDLRFADGTFDVVLCTEMIEHDSAFWTTLSEIGRVLKVGGHLLLTTRGNGFGEHDYPSDYWRFMRGSADPICSLAGCRVESQEDDPTAPGIYVHGIRV